MKLLQDGHGSGRARLAFREVLLNREELVGVLNSEDIDGLLDPITYIGMATSMVDRVLSQTRAAGWLEEAESGAVAG